MTIQSKPSWPSETRKTANGPDSKAQSSKQSSELRKDKPLLERVSLIPRLSLWSFEPDADD